MADKVDKPIKSKVCQLLIMARSNSVPSLTTASFPTMQEAEEAVALIRKADEVASWG